MVRVFMHQNVCSSRSRAAFPNVFMETCYVMHGLKLTILPFPNAFSFLPSLSKCHLISPFLYIVCKKRERERESSFQKSAIWMSDFSPVKLVSLNLNDRKAVGLFMSICRVNLSSQIKFQGILGFVFGSPKHCRCLCLSPLLWAVAS